MEINIKGIVLEKFFVEIISGTNFRHPILGNLRKIEEDNIKNAVKVGGEKDGQHYRVGDYEKVFVISETNNE